MGIFSSLFGSKSKSKSQYDPWDESTKYLLGNEDTPGVFPEVAKLYEESGWTPEMETAANEYRNLLAARYADPHYMGVNDAGINLLDGQYDPNISGISDIRGVSPIKTRDVISNNVGFNGVNSKNISAGSIINKDTILPDARRNQGVLDPTRSLSQLLTGRPDSPYLDSQANAIVNTLTRNMNENIMPGIRGDAILSGQYGGSRQGLAEGLAVSRLNQDLAPALTNLYGTAYENAQGRMYGTASDLNNQAYAAELGNVERDLFTKKYNNDMAYQSAVDNANRDLISQQYNSTMGYQAGVDNANRNLSAQQYNAGLTFDADTGNRTRDLNTQQYNAGLGLSNNQQELQRSSQVVDNRGQGLSYLSNGMDLQDNLYDQYVNSYLQPQQINSGNVNNYANAMYTGAQLGGQSSGKNTQTPSPFSALLGTATGLMGMARGFTSPMSRQTGINFQQQGGQQIPSYMFGR